MGQQARYTNNDIGMISSTGDGGKRVSVSNTNDSELSNFMNVTPYGFSSAPRVGSMAFTIVCGCKTGMIGVYDKDKPSVKSGCSMMYSSGGAQVYCVDDKVLINSVDILDKIDKIEKRLNNHGI